MFHLFQHAKGKLRGKYDFAFIKNGNFICGSSPQGNDQRKSVYKAMYAICQANQGINITFQDDTLEKPVIYFLSKIGTKFILTVTKYKAKKRYAPAFKQKLYDPLS